MIKNIEDLKKYTLLYVEDEEVIRSNVVTCLSHIFNVISAEDGQDGIDKFYSKNIDLVITDLNMPNKDGLTMLREIKIHSPYTPTIVTSAYAEELHSKLVEIGITKSLKKPFNVKDLILDSMDILNIEHEVQS